MEPNPAVSESSGRAGHEQAITDTAAQALDRLEWNDARRSTPDRPPRMAMARRSALAGGGAGLAALMLAACSSGSDAAATSQGGASKVFGASGKKSKFVFVNHVTTNPFFVPDSLRR